MIVIMIAITPSLKASNRPLVICAPLAYAIDIKCRETRDAPSLVFGRGPDRSSRSHRMAARPLCRLLTFTYALFCPNDPAS